MKPVSLYGGALRTVLPPGFIDASLLRPVPDTQEVYVNGRQEGEDYGDGLGLNESITVDLLERIEASSDEDALKEHVTEIFDLNGSTNCQMDQLHRINSSVYACIAHDVNLVLCVGLIRLPQYGTDVVITINVPGQAVRTGEELPKEVQATNKVLTTILNQFEVVDGSLFV
ncbi:hypothetical protein ZYGR_0Z00910 [Zygosaccharomyces rouxii]|uniref:Mog1p/PsbP-like protein n=1 Tax=Zygosaccharomyces rouxii TaxID=4956 RepID=A0A1Q3A4S5_ZYGRO|nr:hypothetical protein ZYGR_0Z00910 [Zygosaccharomyces rouxii]